LHGLIVADTYGIPCRWAEITSLVAGNGFKFRDYFYSIGISNCVALNLKGIKQVDPDMLIKSIRDYNVKIDLDQLMDACPYWREG